MHRRALITTLTLSAIAGALGLTLGLRHAEGDISGLVNAVALEHARSTGTDAAECVGWIADGESRPKVRCGRVVYRIDQFGNAVKITEPGT